VECVRLDATRFDAGVSWVPVWVWFRGGARAVFRGVLMVDANGNKWLSLLKRLTSMAKTEHVNHPKIIKVTLVTDQDGNLVVWSAPVVTMLEPNADARAWVNSL